MSETLTDEEYAQCLGGFVGAVVMNRGQDGHREGKGKENASEDGQDHCDEAVERPEEDDYPAKEQHERQLEKCGYGTDERWYLPPLPRSGA